MTGFINSSSQRIKRQGEKTKAKQVATEKPQSPQTKSAVEEMCLLGVRKQTHEADIEKNPLLSKEETQEAKRSGLFLRAWVLKPLKKFPPVI